MLPRIGWTLLALILIGASLHIPIFSGQDASKGVVAHPRLFPYYFQTNIDAPVELSSSLGFPAYYKIAPNRVNRPVVYGGIAAVREGIAEPALLLILGPDDGPRWGRWTAREYLATYALWFLFNWILIAAVAIWIYRLAKAHAGSEAASFTAILFLSSPIVLLSAREIHLGAFHMFVAIACAGFWHAVLLGAPIDAGSARRALSGASLALASFGLGVLFLGKPCLDGFGAGLLAALWMRRFRNLPLILACAALPTLLWMAAVKAAGYPYAVGEVKFGAGVWLLDVEGPVAFLGEVAEFSRQWMHCLGENVSLAHLPLAAFGAWTLRTRPEGRALLAASLLAMVSAAGFYFIVHRANGVYVMFPLYFFFLLAAVGLKEIATRIAAANPARAAWTVPAAFATLLAIQLMLAWRQLPQYAG